MEDSVGQGDRLWQTFTQKLFPKPAATRASSKVSARLARQQASKQGNKQAGRQASRQAGRQSKQKQAHRGNKQADNCMCAVCCHRVRCVSISNKYSHDELCHCRRCYLSVFFNLVVRENSIRGLVVVPAVLVSHSTVQTVLTTCLDCGCLPPFKQFHSNSLDSGCRL